MVTTTRMTTYDSFDVEYHRRTDGIVLAIEHSGMYPSLTIFQGLHQRKTMKIDFPFHHAVDSAIKAVGIRQWWLAHQYGKSKETQDDGNQGVGACVLRMNDKHLSLVLANPSLAVVLDGNGFEVIN
jgi:hypothetical protein